MTDFTQTMTWLGEGFIGQIPVWDSTGAQVGYRTSYDNAAPITFNSSYHGDTVLFSKDFWGFDVKITLPASVASGALDILGPVSITGSVTGPTTAANYPAGSAAQAVAATADNVRSAVVSATDSVTGAVSDLSLLTNAWQQYKYPVLLGVGTIALLWLVMGHKHHG
jgi:hypothetical protein